MDGLIFLTAGPAEHDALINDPARYIPALSGDCVVAFSDGVTEAFNDAGEEFSDERLVERVQSHRKGTPQEILDSLLNDVRVFSGNAPQSDDLTIVMVKYDG